MNELCANIIIQYYLLKFCIWVYLVSTAQQSGNKATLVDCGESRPNITWMYGAVKVRLVQYLWDERRSTTRNNGKAWGCIQTRTRETSGISSQVARTRRSYTKFHKARSVLYSMKARIKEELDRLLNLDILQPVQFPDWATPVVPVLKPDNSVHLYGDYKVTLNPVSKLEQYPVPIFQNQFAILGGGK